MRYLSMFSGIEAASVAWEPLGWEPAAFCEIEPFPSAVLAHHYPHVPNLGDVTKADFSGIGSIDLAVFGSPCQSYSVAGKRLGLDDPRGNLALVAGRVIYRKRPRWFTFENVPGILSSDGGWDFGTILAAFAGYPSGSVFAPPADGWGNGGVIVQANSASYGLAWRILDAQYFGVPQRRRRVFVVGHLGDWRRAAAVLFERHSLSGHPAPRRQAGQDVAGTFTSRAKSGGWSTDVDLASSGYMQPVPSSGNVSHCLNAGGMGRQDYESETLIAFNLRGREDGAQPEADPDNLAAMRAASGGSSRSYVAFGWQNSPSQGDSVSEHTVPTLDKSKTPAVAFGGDTVRSLTARHDSSPCADRGMDVIASGPAVRRLTPSECERLQGFPDDYTLVPYRGKPAADGPRYKALGNSMAVPVMAFIGQRIAAVEAIKVERIAA